jgi:hypothetical protein
MPRSDPTRSEIIIQLFSGLTPLSQMKGATAGSGRI